MKRENGPSSHCSNGQIHCLDHTARWQITCLVRNKWVWTRTPHFSYFYLHYDEIHSAHTWVVMMLQKYQLSFHIFSVGQFPWPHTQLPVLWCGTLLSRIRDAPLSFLPPRLVMALALLLILCSTDHYSKSLWFFLWQTICTQAFMRSFVLRIHRSKLYV